APPTDEPALADAAARWCAGQYAWMAVTSRNAVLALARAAEAAGVALADAQPGSQVATGGASTLGVCADVGLDVTLVPSGKQAAAGIVEDFPDAPTGGGAAARVLAPLGNLASPILSRGLSRKGWHVDEVEAYRTVDGVGPSAAVRDAIAGGEIDAIILTSASVAHRLRRDCPEIPDST